MCSSQAKVTTGIEITATPGVAKINGRAVLQPTCNRVPTILERRNSLTKISPKSSPPPPPPPSQMTCLGMISSSAGSNNNKASISSSIITPGVPASNLVSPKSKSPRPPATKRSSGSNELNMNASNSASDHDKVVLGAVTPRNTSSSTITAAAAAVSNPRLERKKSKSFKELSSTVSSSSSSSCITEASFAYSSSLIIEAPGSIAAGRREQMAQQHAQRKMKIAHYGRSKSAKFETHNSSKFVPIISDSSTTEEEKRCSFITQNSDPIYVAYHDEEWGVPVHDDELLFELLVLSGAQVGSDWTTILKKRQDFRDAFTGYEAERVAQISEKQMISISTTYGIDISRVRGAVDNSARILEIKKEFGSFEKYIWAFVNNKPIPTQYKFGHKIPVKTSKSETISKDMVRRGFRFVGPTVLHSFMQAAGLTNDHLITCHRHLPCTLLAARLLLEREEPQTN